jgi:hypothetical protein
LDLQSLNFSKLRIDVLLHSLNAFDWSSAVPYVLTLISFAQSMACLKST